MKQAFVVVVDHKEPLNEIQLSMIIQSGLFDHYYENGDKISVVKATKQNVEQNCGTPENVNQKALSLLKRAAQSLNDYSDYTGGCMKDSLEEEIEEYIMNNTKEQTE